MGVISLIVFNDNYYGHSIIFIVHEINYTKYMLLNTISKALFVGPIYTRTSVLFSKTLGPMF